MRISLGYTFVPLLLALALTNQAFAAVYRPVNDDSSDESCEDTKSEVQCRLKPADDPGCYLELVPNHGWMQRSCPEGTLFSERDCGCSVSLPQQDQDDSDSSSEEDNGKTAPVACTRKPTHDRRSYMQFVEGKGWNRQSCPDGTAYSAEDCSCTLFLSDDSSSSSEENIWGKADAKVCNREAEDDSHFYMEMVQGHGWIRRACAKGTMFDASTCRCSASEDGSSDSSCEDDDSESEEWDGHCLLKATSSQNNFLQFVEGHGWMTRHCPKGTAFNAGDCGCTVSVRSDESSSSEEDSWQYQSYGKSQSERSGYDDSSSSSSSSSSEEDSNHWRQQTYGKGLSVHEGDGDSSSEEDGSSWNTANYRKGAIPAITKNQPMIKALICSL
ncbi:unnamed protein product [Acanthosepion pharaonis]|uniref:Uncharacterized protein n=1 Tax=Acanthosepion pharaonis TaxID=158019 RepID=A0A812D392_ACAPH|nr:unnamed protein product [Sepia pharaonis]